MATIGNLDIEWASELSAKYGYRVFLGGMYRWSDDRTSGSSFMPGKCMTKEDLFTTYNEGEDVSFGKEFNGQELPQYLWYCEESDTFLVSIHESYGQGQSSSAYFQKE